MEQVHVMVLKHEFDAIFMKLIQDGINSKVVMIKLFKVVMMELFVALIIVTKKNTFYAFGRNEPAQFANNKKSKSNLNSPKLLFSKIQYRFARNNINNNTNIIQIECGKSLPIFLSSNGQYIHVVCVIIYLVNVVHLI